MIVSEYYYQDSILYVRVHSDQQRYILRKSDNQQFLEVEEPSNLNNEYIEGEFAPDADTDYYENDMAKDILKILIGEEEE